MDQQLLEKSPVHPEQLNKNVVYCNDKYSLYSTDTEERVSSLGEMQTNSPLVVGIYGLHN